MFFALNLIFNGIVSLTPPLSCPPSIHPLLFFGLFLPNAPMKMNQRTRDYQNKNQNMNRSKKKKPEDQNKGKKKKF